MAAAMRGPRRPFSLAIQCRPDAGFPGVTLCLVGGRFVGRAAELAQVRGLVSVLAGGVGGVLLVTGEQGIGKSALLREGLAGAVAAGCRMGWGVGDELTMGLPLRVMAECLGTEGRLAVAGPGPVPGWEVLGADPVAAAAERLLVVADQLCARSPVVLVAEDLQWADEASLLVWRRLARAVQQLPLLVVGTLRPGSGREDLAQLAREVTATGRAVQLGPLPRAEVAELAAGLLEGRPGRRLAGVLDQAGGNPLYVAELAAAVMRDGRVAVSGELAELAGKPRAVPVPGSLVAAIGDRLAGLPAVAIGVLRWAAVLGSEFSAADVGLVTGRPPEELAELLGAAVAAGVLADAGSRLAFRHGLIRQVLYEGIPASVREALHAQAARALAVAGTPAGAVAAQLNAAPEVAEEWAWDWLATHAGVLAYQAPQVAAQLLRRALPQLAEADPRREGLEVALVRVASLLAQKEEAERVALPLLARTASPDLAAETAWMLVDTLRRTGRTGEAAAVVEQALARPGTSQAWHARLRSAQALTQLMLSQWEQGAQTARQALAEAEQAGDRLASGYALHALSQVELSQRGAHGLDYINEALAVIGDDAQATDLRLVLLANRESRLEDTDRMAEADVTIREALALAERVGTPRLPLICTAAGDYYFEVGQWDEALTVLETVDGRSDDETIPILLHGQIALIAAHRDQWHLADEHLTAVHDLRIDTASRRMLAYCLLRARALAAERAGGPAGAVAVLAPYLDLGVAQDMQERYLLLPSLARAAVASGDTQTAAAAARAAAQEADDDPLPVKSAAAHWCSGLAESDPGPVAAAAAYYQAAGRPLNQGQALEDTAALLAARGEHDAAHQAFARAARRYVRLGAEWDLRLADVRLRSHGIRRGRGRQSAMASGGWQALTPTETKIAALVADGRSNPDIAGELFLSRSTVQTHVSHILAKLGVHSRAEIIRQAVLRTRGRQAAS
jgi:DNA-binding CsgD family transcriptional regulator